MNHLIIDTETSGLSPRFNTCLTVGLLHIKTNPKTFKIISEDHIKIKHQNYNPNPFAMRVNKINLEEHHKLATPPKLACKQINSFIEENRLTKSPLIGHNLPFDLRFLSALSIQAKTELLLPQETIDTKNVWKNLQAQQKIPHNPKCSLKTLANHFEIDYSSAHDALADCHITARAYHEMLKIK